MTLDGRSGGWLPHGSTLKITCDQGNRERESERERERDRKRH